MRGNLGSALLLLGKTDEAINQLEDALKENPRAVKTASVAQVPEGSYQTSVVGWESYKKFLNPLYLTLKKSGALKEWDKNNLS